jgi:hypothetical protein
MFELKLSDVPPNKSTTGYLTALGEFSPEVNSKSLEGFTFTEFSLEELGLPNYKEMLEGVIKVKNEIGLAHWRTGEHISPSYFGFSLTHNPDYIDKDVSIYHQTWGSNLLSQSFAYKNGKGKHDNIKNTYYDTYGFRKTLPIIDKHLGFLLNRFSCPLLRSRVAFYNMYSRHPVKTGWHIDEVPNQLLRINIPLQTSEEYILEIEGSDEYGNSISLRNKHLEVGKAYLWNTRIPHGVAINKFCENPEDRIHFVLGFSPWFDYNNDTDSFVRSKNYGIPLTTIIKERLFLKS